MCGLPPLRTTIISFIIIIISIVCIMISSSSSIDVCFAAAQDHKPNLPGERERIIKVPNAPFGNNMID